MSILNIISRIKKIESELAYRKGNDRLTCYNAGEKVHHKQL